MAKVSGYKCECGKRKTEANRWLLGLPMYRSYSFIGLRAWNDSVATWDRVLHFCSEACAYKWLAQELERMGR